jgi:hypothetical protein
MKIVKALFCLLALTLFGAILLPSAQADDWNKKTVVTFSQAVEVPGKILPAGTSAASAEIREVSPTSRLKANPSPAYRRKSPAIFASSTRLVMCPKT